MMVWLYKAYGVVCYRCDVRIPRVMARERAARSVAALVLAACAAAAPAGVVQAPAAAPAPTELAALDPADVEVPAWRDLWYGSLEALHREPTINNTQEDVLAQLGSLAFLHCPVRNLGERGVSLALCAHTTSLHSHRSVFHS